MKRTDALVARAKQLRADGWSYWEIGGELGVSEPTARLWCDDLAREVHRLRAAQSRQYPVNGARELIAKLAGRCVISQPAVTCTGEWASDLQVHCTDGRPRHVDELNLPVGLQRRRLHNACRALAALSN